MLLVYGKDDILSYYDYALEYDMELLCVIHWQIHVELERGGGAQGSRPPLCQVIQANK